MRWLGNHDSNSPPPSLSRAEVPQSNVAARVNQNVFGFEISAKHAGERSGVNARDGEQTDGGETGARRWIPARRKGRMT